MLIQESPVSLFLPTPGVLQVLLPELLALAAQHRGPAPPQSPDEEPEEPRFQLEEPALPGGLWCPSARGWQVRQQPAPPGHR